MTLKQPRHADLRHSYVSLMHDAGFSLERIGDYVGHFVAAERFGDYLMRAAGSKPNP
jgi:hypothetical protein